MSPESKKLFNVIILGASFMFIFTAFQTCGNIAQTVITNLNSTDFHGSGYTSMSIIYGVFSASNLISPSVVAIVGPQLPMVVSGVFYSLYIAVFIQPATWAFYTASVFIGIAAAESDRRTVFIALTVISLVGTVLFFLIRKQEDTKTPGEEDSAHEILGDSSNFFFPRSAQNKMMRAVAAFKKSIKLSFTKEILLLSVTTAYTGLELTFFSGVYGTCIGAVNRFGSEQKSLIGLSGIFLGVGEILGGGVFGLLSKNNRFGRNPVVMLGIVVHFIAFYLIFFNTPNDAPIAPMEGTDHVAYMIPSKEVAVFCSFLLGLGDSCFNTQLLSILGFLYSEDSAPAFAIFKFVQSVCAAVAYFYSNYLLLQWQLLIMVVVGFFGTITFFMVEWKAAAALAARSSDYSSI
ncbi:PREDICTED: UNC93-like protein MFSD11 isoform X2 [Buceros rhinoceros silvestris]|uniref:UNC93-like protein MFSD11 isoform X2 n=1 Tax=Buceros rhinoceros silvestris TaxID=175836 RepID=UPI000528CFFA|nr:PREDICTED: UNC93-like protein MFSD11 isoform X2 [Buceros rhinoceros silvestris]